jgi:broad specificity phosphatase PhoE
MVILDMSKKYNNKYYILRHGEALSNKKEIISCWPEKFHNPLSLRGRKQIKSAARKLKTKKIDLIFASDLLRTRQTAEIVGKVLEVNPKHDKRLREYKLGIFNGKTIKDFRKFLPLGIKRFKDKPPKGETYADIKKRVCGFLEEIDKKYSGKNILIISHQIPLTLLEESIKGLSPQEFIRKYPSGSKKKIKTGELRKLI